MRTITSNKTGVIGRIYLANIWVYIMPIISLRK